MADATTQRAEAIEDFAAALTALRESVGTPSFRVMAGRSHAISHTTLHEAAQGNRLPSWSTTAEFVKACGADPADYRERWERANEVVTAACSGQACPEVVDDGPTRAATAAVPSTSVPSTSAPAKEVPAKEVPAVEVPAVPTRRSRRYGVAAAVAALVVIAAVAGWAVGERAGSPRRGASPARVTPALSAADCPVHQQNPPSAYPAHEGDRAAFVADLTLPDCTHVHRGQTVQKVWRLKNAGTVPWSGYALHRVDLPEARDQCQTITDVPIPDTRPGADVDVAVAVTLPARPGFCFVRFKMVDAAGRVAFPGSRPVNFQVVVD